MTVLMFALLFLTMAEAAAANASQPASKAYVCNYGSGNISVVDLKDCRVTGSIDLPAHPEKMAISPDGNRLYVLNSVSDSMTVLNTSDREPEAVLKTGDNPHAIAVSRPAARVVASCDDGIEIFCDQGQIASIQVKAPGALIAGPAEDLVYALDVTNSSVLVIDATHCKVVSSIPVTQHPVDLAVSPDGTVLYVSSVAHVGACYPCLCFPFSLITGLIDWATGSSLSTTGTNMVQAIDIASKVPVASRHFDLLPKKLAMSPDGAELIVACCHDERSITDYNIREYEICVINPEDLTPKSKTAVDFLYIEWMPISMAFEPASHNVYITAPGHGLYTSRDNILVLNSTTGSEEMLLVSEVLPDDTVFSPDGSLLYGACADEECVLLVNKTDGTTIDRVQQWCDPRKIAVSPDGTRIYALDYLSPYLTIIDTATYAVVDRVRVGDYPNYIETSADGRYIYVGNQYDGNITVIEAASGSPIREIHRMEEIKCDIAVAPAGSEFYVVGRDNPGYQEYSRVLAIVKPEADFSIEAIPIGGTPKDIAVAPDGKQIYVLMVYVNATHNGSIVVVDRDTSSVLKTIDIRIEPEQLDVDPSGSTVYLLDQNLIYPMDAASLTLGKPFSAGCVPRYFAAGPDGRIFICNWDSGEVYILDKNGERIAAVPVGINPVEIAFPGS